MEEAERAKEIHFGQYVSYRSAVVARLGNRFVQELERGEEPDEEQILVECQSEAQRNILRGLFPSIREELHKS